DTYASNAAGSVAYVSAWTETVRRAGYRPGVYSNPGPIAALAVLSGDSRPDFVWVASWVSHNLDTSLKTAAIHLFHDGLWNAERSRAWQYAGAFGDTPCQVRGMNVDISITDVAAGRPR